MDREVLQGDVQALVDELEAEYPVDLFMYPVKGTNGVRIATIRVPAEHRGEGVGSQVLDRITDWADDLNITLVLTPQSEGRGAPSKSALVRWYRSFGFVPNKGHNKDYHFMDTMIRRPDGEGGATRVERLRHRLANAL